jgi:hypothetical protein
MLLEIAEPDTSRPARRSERFTAIEGLRSLA